MKYGLDASKEFSDFLRERCFDTHFYIVVRFGLNLINISVSNEFLSIIALVQAKFPVSNLDTQQHCSLCCVT